MNNADQPVSAVDDFAEKARNVGAYNASQAANQTTALKLVKDELRKTNTKVDQMKVGDLLEQVDAILDRYGGQTKATPASITAYKWRAKRLLSDFIDRHDGDFMAWKTELARKSAGAKASKKPKAAKAPAAPPPPPPPLKPDDGATDGQKAYELRVGASKSGKLVLPDPLSQKEIDFIWKQLSAYRTLLETMVEPEEGTEE